MMSRTLFACLFVCTSFFATAQQPDTLIKKLDSLNTKTDTTGKQQNNTDPEAYNDQTKITFGGYFILLGSDIKQQLLSPLNARKKDWWNAAKFTGLVAALSFADKPIQRGAVNFRNNNPAVKDISNYVTSFGGLYETYILGGLGAYGFIFKKEKIKTTTLLATHAYLTGGLIENIVKFLAGRERPNYNEANPDFIRPTGTFHGPFYKSTKDLSGKHINSSFPSGHTTVAFAAARVFAMEYKDKPIIPIVAYSAATLVGISRITENKHWLTDVLCGAALGYLCGTQVVNNYHRYAKLKAPKQSKNSLTFNISSVHGKMIPGLVYSFR